MSAWHKKTSLVQSEVNNDRHRPRRSFDFARVHSRADGRPRGAAPYEFSDLYLCQHNQGAELLLKRHRQIDAIFGLNQVVVVILADMDLHPIDLAGKFALA